MTQINDTIAQATRLVMSHLDSYNPGMYITVDGTPLTVRGTLCAADINAQVKAKLLRGGKRNHADYVGFLFVTFYSNDPDAWINLFAASIQRLSYGEILHRITGLPSNHTASFVNASETLFKGEGEPDNPITQEKVLRSLLKY